MESQRNYLRTVIDNYLCQFTSAVKNQK